MKKFYYVLAGVAVVGIGAVGYNVGSNALGPAVSAPIELEGLDSPEALAEMAQGITRGDEDAPVTIVEFGDFQCPGCGAFALSVKPQIDLMLVQTGKVKFIFYDFPLTTIHPNAFLAARASRCAQDQDKYWEYHDVLFRNQANWSTESNATGTFLGYGEDLGVNEKDFEACVRSDKYADVVTANMELGMALGVGSTPTLLVQAGDEVRQLNGFDYRSVQEAVELVSTPGGTSPGN